MAPRSQLLALIALALVAAPVRAQSRCAHTLSERPVTLQIRPAGTSQFILRVEADTARVDLSTDAIEVEGAIRAAGTGATALPWRFAQPFDDPTGIVHASAGLRPTLTAADGGLRASVRIGYGVSVAGIAVPCHAVTLGAVDRTAREPAPDLEDDGTRWSPRTSHLTLFARPDPDAPSVVLRAQQPEDVALGGVGSRRGWRRVRIGRGRVRVVGWARGVDLRPHEAQDRGGGGIAGLGGGRSGEPPADFEGEIALPADTALFAEREVGRWGETARPLEARVRWTVRDADGDTHAWVRVLSLPGVQELVTPRYASRPRPSEVLVHAFARIPLSAIPNGGAIRARVLGGRPTSPGVEALTAERRERGVARPRRLAVSLASHGCLVRDGRVRCWGENGRGQLGDGTTADRDEAASVPGLEDAVSVAVSADVGFPFTCALRETGEVACWGAPAPGPSRPRVVEGLRDVVALAGRCVLHADGSVACGDPAEGFERVEGIADAIAVAAGRSHACALRAGGAVQCWGSNERGQLGVDAIGESARPVDVPGVEDAIDVAVGGSISCARRRDGAVICWGYVPERFDARRTPPRELAQLEGAVEIATDRTVVCGRFAEGPVRCLGGNRADPRLMGQRAWREPVGIDRTDGAAAFALGGDTGCVLDRRGRAACWGRRRVHTPRRVPGVTGARVIAAGGHASCAGGPSGMTCWPGGSVSEAPIADLSIGLHGSCAVETSGELRCRGSDASAWDDVTGASAVSAALGVTCAVVDGVVRCELPRGRMADPSDVLGPVVDVGAAFRRICSVERSGRVVCWGSVSDEDYGEPEEPDPPVAVPGVTDALEVEVGNGHACTRRRSGQITCFTEDGALDLPGFPSSRGFDVAGREVCVVDGAGRVHCLQFHARSELTRAHYGRPERVTGIDGAIDVAIGSTGQYCALHEDGGALCWGDATGGVVDGALGPVPVEER